MRGYLLPGSKSRAGSFQSPKTLAPLWDFCRHSWIESLSARVYTLAKASEQKHRQLLFNKQPEDSLLFLPHFQWNSDTPHFYLTSLSLFIPHPASPKLNQWPHTTTALQPEFSFISQQLNLLVTNCKIQKGPWNRGRDKGYLWARSRAQWKSTCLGC